MNKIEHTVYLITETNNFKSHFTGPYLVVVINTSNSINVSIYKRKKMWYELHLDNSQAEIRRCTKSTTR